ncbi:MAG: glutamate racemase [Oscillospiraceae bacterium]|nr:glutamate racemase [Oscillospiraceae bacterium]
MDNRPIGVFDSGLGGLTAVREILNIMPQENVVYFGDTGRVPYGTRSRETILKYAAQDMAFLRSKDVKLVIAACGTVSSVAGALGDALPVPYTGVVRPTALASCLATRNGKIGVIGTTATIRSGSYRRAIHALDKHLSVFEQDCPLFVPLVENDFYHPDNPVPRLVAERYLAPLKQAGVDTLIMGCTHYPLLRETIQQVMGPQVVLIDSGRETAACAMELLRKENALCESGETGRCSFFVSDSTEGFSKAASLFLDRDVTDNVSYIDIVEFAEAHAKTTESEA